MLIRPHVYPLLEFSSPFPALAIIYTPWIDIKVDTGRSRRLATFIESIMTKVYEQLTRTHIHPPNYTILMFHHK